MNNSLYVSILFNGHCKILPYHDMFLACVNALDKTKISDQFNVLCCLILSIQSYREKGGPLEIQRGTILESWSVPPVIDGCLRGFLNMR